MPWKEAWRLLRKDKLAMISLVVISVCLLLAALVQPGFIGADVGETHRLKRIEIGEPSVLRLLIHEYGALPLLSPFGRTALIAEHVSLTWPRPRGFLRCVAVEIGRIIHRPY